MSRSYAYRLIESAKVVEDVTVDSGSTSADEMSPMGDKLKVSKGSKMSPIGDKVLPKNEGQVRKLTQVHSPASRRAIWLASVAAAQEKGEAVTAKTVEEQIEKHQAAGPDTTIPKLRQCPDPDGIATWTWEPIDFTSPVPNLREGQLAAVMHSRPPANSGDEEDLTVVVCPGADLFAAAVPDKVIEDVLAAAEGAPHWVFLAISKNYLRLFSYTYPSNIWAGAQVSTRREFDQAQTAAAAGKAGTKFIYCCPLNDDVNLVKGAFHWVLIAGADPQPDSGRVLHLTCQALGFGIPVLWAESLQVRCMQRPSYKA
jgi:hypothetical protein